MEKVQKSFVVRRYPADFPQCAPSSRKWSQNQKEGEPLVWKFDQACTLKKWRRKSLFIVRSEFKWVKYFSLGKSTQRVNKVFGVTSFAFFTALSIENLWTMGTFIPDLDPLHWPWLLFVHAFQASAFPLGCPKIFWAQSSEWVVVCLNYQSSVQGRSLMMIVMTWKICVVPSATTSTNSSFCLSPILTFDDNMCVLECIKSTTT